MTRLCSILLLATLMTVIVWAQGSGSTRQAPVTSTGGSANLGTDLPFMITRIVKGKIAEIKMPDLNCDTIEAAMKMIEGSARSMGLTVAE